MDGIISRSARILLLTVALIGFLLLPGRAQTSYTGTTVGALRFRRPNGGNPPISLASTSGTNGNSVPYHTYSFTPSVTAQYRIVSTTQAPVWDNFVVVYRGAFTPGSALTNVIAANDDFGSTIKAGIDALPLTAGQAYTIVVTGFGNTAEGAFETVITQLPATIATTGGPVFNRPIANGSSPPTQLSGATSAVPFGVLEYHPAETGTYRLTSLSTTPGFNTFTVLYQNSFLVNSPLTNALIANENLGGETLSGFETTLTAGKTYFFVTAGSTMDDFGAYTATIERIFAQNLSGTTISSPAYNRPNEGAPPTTLSTQGTAVPYTVFKVTVSANGIGNFTVTSQTTGYDLFTSLYQTDFNPDKPLQSILLANDDKGSTDTSGFDSVPLTAGTEYFLVVGGYNNSDFGDFTLAASSTQPLTVTTYGSVTGTVTQAECPGKAFEATFTFRPPDSSGDIVRQVQVDATGHFTVKDLRTRIYKVKVKGVRTLSRVGTADVSRGFASLAVGALPGGDANDDNIVDVLDLDVFIRAFDSEQGQPHYNPGTDFNSDGYVDVLDLDVLLRNFDKSGAEFP